MAIWNAGLYWQRSCQSSARQGKLPLSSRVCLAQHLHPASLVLSSTLGCGNLGCEAFVMQKMWMFRSWIKLHNKPAAHEAPGSTSGMGFIPSRRACASYGDASVPMLCSMEKQCHLLADETFPNQLQQTSSALLGTRPSLIPVFKINSDTERASRRRSNMVCIATTLMLCIKVVFFFG